jgi:hypothetical protein
MAQSSEAFIKLNKSVQRIFEKDCTKNERGELCSGCKNIHEMELCNKITPDNFNKCVLGYRGNYNYKILIGEYHER